MEAGKAFLRIRELSGRKKPLEKIKVGGRLPSSAGQPCPRRRRTSQEDNGPEATGTGTARIGSDRLQAKASRVQMRSVLPRLLCARKPAL